MGATIAGCSVNALSDRDSRRPDKTRSVASGMGAVLLFCLSKTLADDLQTLTDLSVFNGERYKDAQHVVIRAAGEKNQALIAGACHDLGGEFCVRFAVIAVLIHEKYEKNREDIGLFGI